MKINLSLTEETNWNFKFDEDVVPFFHYVNGNKDQVNLTIHLKSACGDIIDTREICENFPAFGSKVFLMDALFEDLVFEEGMFCGVECYNDTVFRRMVVGNFHKSHSHLEVTHSFFKQVSKDYCPKNSHGYESFLALYNNDNLSLSAGVFPTNNSVDFDVKESNQNYLEETLDGETDTSLLASGYGAIELDNIIE